MALVRCQPPDDLPCKTSVLLLRGVEDKCEKNANLGESRSNRLSSFLYRVKAYFKKQTRKGGFIMNDVDYKAMLYEKMNNEQNSYRKWLLSQQPAEILITPMNTQQEKIF